MGYILKKAETKQKLKTRVHLKTMFSILMGLKTKQWMFKGLCFGGNRSSRPQNSLKISKLIKLNLQGFEKYVLPDSLKCSFTKM